MHTLPHPRYCTDKTGVGWRWEERGREEGRRGGGEGRGEGEERGGRGGGGGGEEEGRGTVLTRAHRSHCRLQRSWACGVCAEGPLYPAVVVWPDFQSLHRKEVSKTEKICFLFNLCSLLQTYVPLNLNSTGSDNHFTCEAC